MNKYLRKLKFKLTPKSMYHDHFAEPKKPQLRMFIMRGLPASGKSTKAKGLVEANKNMVRVNKDLLREMLHFNAWSNKNEQLTQKAMRAVVECMAKENVHVIIDETNLNPRTYKSNFQLGQDLGYLVDTLDMGTTAKECIDRDAKRDKPVGSDVIVGMAMMNKQYPMSEKGTVIYDIDGTIADIAHRKHFVTKEVGKKDWKSFFEAMTEDQVREDIKTMYLKDIEDGYSVVLVSGRPANYRILTQKWLEHYGFNGHKALFMRPEHDSRADTIIKQEIYDKYLKHYNVVKVVDDRPSVIRMWASNGLNVVDVGDGIEF